MDLPHRAEVRIDCGDQAVAEQLCTALGVEADEGPEGSLTELRTDASFVVIATSGPDLRTLRASLQGMVRLADAALRVASGQP